MEEQNKNNVTEEQKVKNKGELPARSCMLMVLAGIYLIYTGYRLCRNVLDGAEGAAWGFFVAGVVFLVLGAGMLFVGGRGVIRDDRRKKAEAAALAAEEQKNTADSAEETSAPQPEEPQKKMSIADRANLVNRIDGEED